VEAEQARADLTRLLANLDAAEQLKSELTEPAELTLDTAFEDAIAAYAQRAERANALARAAEAHSSPHKRSTFRRRLALPDSPGPIARPS
jgi:hypothetical protein